MSTARGGGETAVSFVVFSRPQSARATLQQLRKQSGPLRPLDPSEGYSLTRSIHLRISSWMPGNQFAPPAWQSNSQLKPTTPSLSMAESDLGRPIC